MTPADFQPLIARITESASGRPLDDEPAGCLDETFPPGHETLEDIRSGC
ncbi:MAG: hypothetical protein MAG794_00762 [Gammaproteobacteria bacterium]|nr:hypothetical protein [Gammaproteobacteria bacterium]